MQKLHKLNIPAFCLGLVGFCLAFKSIGDLDFWWHLSAGRWMIENKSFITSDFLSYTFKDAPWMDLTWGFEVIQYLLYSLTNNYWLISFFFGLIGFFTAYFSYLTFTQVTGEEKDNSSFLGFVFLSIGLFVVDFRWIHRPEQFTHLYGVLLIFILFKNKNEKTKFIWFIPLIQIAWVNTHGLFLIGPVITGAFLFYILTKGKISEIKSRMLTEPLVRVLLVQFLVCLLNPRGWNGATFPFQLWEILNHPFYRNTIPEATNPYKDGVWGMDTWALTIYFVMFCCAFFYPFKKSEMINKIKKYGIGYLVFSLLLFRLSVIARRNIALFVLWTLPIVAFEISKILESTIEYLREEKFKERAVQFICIASSTICLGLITNLLRFEMSNTRFGGEMAAFEFPTGSIVKLKSLQKLPRFFAGVQFSDFMGFHLKGYEPYIDGRFAEVYPREHFQRYMDILAHPRLIEQEISGRKIEAMGLETRNPMLHGLIRYIGQNPNWKLFYADEAAVIFLKNKEGESFNNIQIAEQEGRRRLDELVNRPKGWNSFNSRSESDKALGLTRLSETLLLLDASAVADEVLTKALKIEREFPSALSMQCVTAFSLLEKKVSQLGSNAEKTAQLVSQESPFVEEACRRAKKKGSDKTTALFTSALLHINLGRYEDSMREFTELVKRDPLRPEAHMLLGRSFAALGKIASAEESYLEAARLRPMEGESLLELANVLDNSGQKDKAKFYKLEASNRMQMQGTSH